MGRKCSLCRKNGHNLRTCSGLRLFGVQLQINSSSLMNKSFSLNCFCASEICIDESNEKIRKSYLSDCLRNRVLEKRKGVSWSEKEHRDFLAGLEKLGKGDWCGISRNFVITRTPTQVASHAQKYFLRKNCLDKKKHRSSLFDAVRSCQGPISSNSKDPSFLNEAPVLIDLNFPAKEAT